MSQSGQQHSKADVGGQRTESKKADTKKDSAAPSVRDSISEARKPKAKSDAKK